ncbi:hypothetical protein [Ramlibacter sp.]|uniref:hypothetical protein n=1 Tax=Ramlibacter sp. TaxID=1917967 RepID=UPI002BA69676|nr:hypothetical protein [Ramlibacter sp.]HWI84345.1 hypothetical protein [Ramlibacter sp.]
MNQSRLPCRGRRRAGRLPAGCRKHGRGRPGLLVPALPRGGLAVGCARAQDEARREQALAPH